MNIKQENLEKARNLLKELETLESALDVLGNYDSAIYVQFYTMHNNNEKRPKTVTIPIDEKVFKGVDAKQFSIGKINHRIEEIKEELEKM
jgi:hypothetical protein